jgi:hypothetical protein
MLFLDFCLKKLQKKSTEVQNISTTLAQKVNFRKELAVFFPEN